MSLDAYTSPFANPFPSFFNWWMDFSCSPESHWLLFMSAWYENQITVPLTQIFIVSIRLYFIDSFYKRKEIKSKNPPVSSEFTANKILKDCLDCFCSTEPYSNAALQLTYTTSGEAQKPKFWITNNFLYILSSLQGQWSVQYTLEMMTISFWKVM